MLTKQELIKRFLDNPEAELNEFRDLTAGLSYERKGVLFSEMFFFWLCARTTKCKRILESGRARGQSTLILSHCFPDADIWSFEHDPESSDVAAADARLRHCDNVRQFFGDGTGILPPMASESDIVLIDGPKGFRGVRLALRLLAKGKVPFVFLHDTNKASVERVFLEKNLPETLYSDCPEFASLAHTLDLGVEGDIPENHRWNKDDPPSDGYGFSLACIPLRSDRQYLILLVRAVIAGFLYRLFKRRNF